MQSLAGARLLHQIAAPAGARRVPQPIADFVAFPRTRDDAVALIERVFERFPEIGTSNT
jgi:hypothetical protein